jgi:hypothetical protein
VLDLGGTHQGGSTVDEELHFSPPTGTGTVGGAAAVGAVGGAYPDATLPSDVGSTLPDFLTFTLAPTEPDPSAWAATTIGPGTTSVEPEGGDAAAASSERSAVGSDVAPAPAPAFGGGDVGDDVTPPPAANLPFSSASSPPPPTPHPPVADHFDERIAPSSHMSVTAMDEELPLIEDLVDYATAGAAELVDLASHSLDHKVRAQAPLLIVQCCLLHPLFLKWGLVGFASRVPGHCPNPVPPTTLLSCCASSAL